MAAIDIGNAATDRSASSWPAGWTVLAQTNPANDTGTLTSIEVWFASENPNGEGVKVGTFSGSGTSWNDRDYETLGNVTAGSKQTFSGLDCDVSTNDLIGIYYTAGEIENDTTGGSGYGELNSDAFGQGVQTFSMGAGYPISLYGTGTTGWATIAKVSGVTEATVGKINSVSKASIAKVLGTAV